MFSSNLLSHVYKIFTKKYYGFSPGSAFPWGRKSPGKYQWSGRSSKAEPPWVQLPLRHPLQTRNGVTRTTAFCCPGGKAARVHGMVKRCGLNAHRKAETFFQCDSNEDIGIERIR